MTNETVVSHYKNWTDEEDLLLLSALEIGKMNGHSKSRLSWTLAPLLGRTDASVSTRLSLLDKPVETPKPKKATVVVKPQVQESPLEEDTQPVLTETAPKEYVPVPIPTELIDSIVEVTAYKMAPYGAFCKTAEGYEGLLHVSTITDGYVADIKSYLEVGDKIKVKVVQDRAGRIGFNAKVVGSLQPKNGLSIKSEPRAYMSKLYR